MSDLVPRHLLERGRQLLDASPCLIVEGARQVGKSTFVTMLVAGRPATVVTLDDSQTRHLAAADPDAFVDQAREATLVIDEIQRSPELILPIKASIDRDRRPGRFVLTGSADLLRLQRTPDSLAGRALTIQLRGFSQGEIRRRPDDFITWLIHAYHDGFNPWAIRSDLTRSDYVDVLAVGSYPQLVLGDPTVRRSWVNSYLRQIIQRDSADVRRVTEPKRLRSLLRLIAANQGGEIVKSRLAEAASVPATTITDYLNVLRSLFLVNPVPAWSTNLTRRETGRAKDHVTDSALALHLARVPPANLVALDNREYLGQLLEGWVAEELARQREWSTSEFDLSHYRESGGLEVDLVVELQDSSIVGIEIKATQSVQARHAAALRRFAHKVGPRFLGGVVLSLTQHGGSYGEGVWALPLSTLWAHPLPGQP